MVARAVFVYATSDGQEPLTNWIETLPDPKTKAVIRYRLARMREGSTGNWKSLKGGLFELKVDLGPGFRIYFGRLGERDVLLLCGGSKKAQKKNIQTARMFWLEYLTRIARGD